MNVDGLLKKIDPNLKYEDLNYQERETMTKWLGQLSTKKLTLEDVKEHVRSLIVSVETELIDTDEFDYVLIFKRVSRKHLLLKARLKNYLLIEALLSSADRAKKMLESYLTNTKT